MNWSRDPWVTTSRQQSHYNQLIDFLVANGVAGVGDPATLILLMPVSMHNSAKLKSPPLSVLFVCLCDKAQKQAECFFCIY